MTQPLGANFDQAIRDAVMGILSDPIAFPEVFKSWVTAWVEANPPILPIGQITGYSVATQTTRVHLAANQSVANSVNTKITYDTVDFDFGGLWDATNHQIKIVTAGKYVIGAGIDWDANATGNRNIAVRVNGSGVAFLTLPNLGAGATVCCSVCTMGDLKTGDLVTVVGTQSSGGALNALGDAATNFFVVRVGS